MKLKKQKLTQTLTRKRKEIKITSNELLIEVSNLYLDPLAQMCSSFNSTDDFEQVFICWIWTESRLFRSHPSWQLHAQS